MGAYAQAVRYYTKASKLLDQYQHLQSFAGIRRDCEKIIRDLSKTLQARLHEPQVGIRWGTYVGTYVCMSHVSKVVEVCDKIAKCKLHRDGGVSLEAGWLCTVWDGAEGTEY